jgi:hypothetical protein
MDIGAILSFDFVIIFFVDLILYPLAVLNHIKICGHLRMQALIIIGQQAPESYGSMDARVDY